MAINKLMTSDLVPYQSPKNVKRKKKKKMLNCNIAFFFFSYFFQINERQWVCSDFLPYIYL